MNGWLIYDSVGVKRNEWFINRLLLQAKSAGLHLQLRTTDEDLFARDLPDFALVRTIAPSLSKRLQDSGVRVFNNAKTAEIANDKYKTYQLCKALDLPVLETTDGADLGYPCVVKSVDGHGGAEVFWADDEQAKARAVARLKDRAYIVQKPCKIIGRDMRVYAIGDRCVGAVLRRSDGDFRSNFSLGGKVEFCHADDSQKAIVRRLHESLQFDFVGVDFLPDGTGGWVVNEIEDCAGARMLYATSDLDITTLMIEQIKTELV